jgi:hypothetical protein
MENTFKIGQFHLGDEFTSNINYVDSSKALYIRSVVPDMVKYYLEKETHQTVAIDKAIKVSEELWEQLKKKGYVE